MVIPPYALGFGFSAQQVWGLTLAGRRFCSAQRLWMPLENVLS